ncbi:HAD hydrolase-like protein [Pedobacter frigoris]|uniref:Haloacid dehalogenase n=1 Tax=Pedobacter frigoris TaxID=2571272 RepID=A0A4U1CGC5_9SPHI|nr:HAD hydrolase-like protein [Pedobacter frigoris]TKC06262.1 haloacid dehalogenase [Pedobacter frigoris]
MAFQQYLKEKQAFIFELDDVIYPQKDYLLQVYYLFAQFIEYAEQISAAEIISEMQNLYFVEGSENIFEKTAAKFGIPEKYKVNFDLLFLSARLPLKLLIFNEVLSLLQAIVIERKQIFLLIDGDPGMQLNKIKQIEWNGLEQYLTVYFTAETSPKPSNESLTQILEKHNLEKERVLMIGEDEKDELCANNSGIEFLQVDKLLLP